MRKYCKGEKIRSLEELMQQDLIYCHHKVLAKGWFQSWQLRFAQTMIDRGVIWKVEQKAYLDFLDKIRQSVNVAIREGEYATWEDFCVELKVPKTIAEGYQLTVWGEEDEENRWYSIWIFWNDHKDSFSVYTDNTTDNDLILAAGDALERMLEMEKKKEAAVCE